MTTSSPLRLPSQLALLVQPQPHYKKPTSPCILQLSQHQIRETNSDLLVQHHMARGAPKIVHIETRYVETDAIHFRDVVQHLTGKNSTTNNWVGNGASFSVTDCNKRGISNDAKKPLEDTPTPDGKKNTFASSMLLMNVSFKDFEGLLSDLPPIEDFLML
ncbi:hypothetical protein VNO78_11130 [Psophocarpus tetragonolobus]|uniref:VQ domain-containing protein n=1 Tax=Psophocarpus tetragonolobus TaxID=3891 RepID=A0AAN9SLV5_PSOTE